jgi:hypothetical protein
MIIIEKYKKGSSKNTQKHWRKKGALDKMKWEAPSDHKFQNFRMKYLKTLIKDSIYEEPNLQQNYMLSTPFLPKDR